MNRGENFFMSFLARVFPTRADDQETLFFKKTMYAVLGLVFVFTILSFAIFFAFMEGEEETLVPQVVGAELLMALDQLQNKELYPKVQTVSTSNPAEKGTVVAQDPPGGMLVKAGRRISLTISTGPIIDKVQNYIGQSFNDVRSHVQSLSSGQARNLFRIVGNPLYIYNSAPAGTILEQKPLPGSPVSGTVDLEFVVSRGPRGEVVVLGDYSGTDYKAVLNRLAQSGQPFLFKSKKPIDRDVPGSVVEQTPVAGAEVPRGTPVNLLIVEPAKFVSATHKFGIFEYNLPDYPILVDLKVELRSNEGVRKTLLSMKHPGGNITIPYEAAPGETIILSIYDKELYSQILN